MQFRFQDSLACRAVEADDILRRPEAEAEQRKRQGNRAGGGDRKSEEAKIGRDKKLSQAVESADATDTKASPKAGHVIEQAAKLFGTNRQYVATFTQQEITVMLGADRDTVSRWLDGISGVQMHNANSPTPKRDHRVQVPKS